MGFSFVDVFLRCLKECHVSNYGINNSRNDYKLLFSNYS
jgi:hypothetical protein